MLPAEGPTVSVVLPTYREEATIGPVLEGLARVLDAAGLPWEAVVIDDESPDGTHPAVQAAAQRLGEDRVRLDVRKGERGLATAVARGFALARGEFVVVMDADGQHPADVVPRLVEAARSEGRDVVVGTRHGKGGSLGAFGPLRRVVSWGAGFLARLALPAVRRDRISDPMSGLFLVRRVCVSGVELRPHGYKILLEVLARGRPRGRRLSVGEVPYAFGERTGGESKLGVRATWDYLVHLARLGLTDRDNRRFAKFAAVGATGVLVNIGLLALFGHFFAATAGVALLLSGAVAREVAVGWNFLWNDLITFRDLRGRTGRPFLVRFLQFNLVSLTSFILYLGVLWALTEFGVHYLVSGTVAVGVSFLINFRGNTAWTYKQRDPGLGFRQAPDRDLAEAR